MEPHVPHCKGSQVTPLVFPLFYNGPVHYFARVVLQEQIVVEQFDSYTKQTFRNRCRILGPNGVLTLSIPVKRPHGIRCHYRDIRIDYDNHWNKIHWRSLVASYAASPYYEFLADDIAPLYEKRFEFLVDLNLRLMECMFRIMGLEIAVTLTGSFEEITGGNDPRAMFHSKRDPAITDPAFQPVPYHQVFSDRHGFQPNLSILDLLFNQGPDAVTLLKNSLRI